MAPAEREMYMPRGRRELGDRKEEREKEGRMKWRERGINCYGQ